MRNSAKARRLLLRLLAGGALTGLSAALAAAQPPVASPSRPKPPRKSRQTSSGLYRPLIVIDPGHGGIDPGAIGAGGVFEKNITFATAIDLAHALRRSAQFRAMLGRGADEYVPLRERVARAEAVHADLLLSLHADALPNPRKRGLSVFTLSATASDREAAALAASENRDIAAGIHLAQYRARKISAVLAALVRRETDNRSVQLARDIISVLGSNVQLLPNPQRSAAFAVLTASEIPSVLVELGCLSNPVEEALLQLPSYRKRLARGLARAIERYFVRFGAD
jgi:N-acetylmuramoyl-L-alanine amidase